MAEIEDRGPWLSTATAIFFSWSLLSFGIRIWVKLGRKQKWGMDDYAISCAFLVTILHIAANFVAINAGYGRALTDIDPSNVDKVYRAIYASEITYIIALGFTRVSTALFIGHLTRHAPQVRMSYILSGVSGIWILASVLVIALRGNLSRPWDTLAGTQIVLDRWIGIEASGLVIEIALWSLSIALIWGLQMKMKKRILILAAFGCRLVLIPIVAIRLLELAPSKNANPTITSIVPHILTEAVLEYALISTSVTALKPFLRPFHTGAIVNSVGGAGSGLYSANAKKSRGVYMLSSNVSAAESKEASQHSRTVRDEEAEMAPSTTQNTFRPERVETQAAVSTTRGQSGQSTRRDDLESIESVGSEQMIIRQTRNWSVRYEDE